MRGVALSFVVSVLALSLWSGARAETPTPTPATAPADASALTIHNLHNGVPYIGGQLSSRPINISYVDGHECNRLALQAVTPLGLLIETRWPWYGGYPCGAIGVPAQVCIDLFGHCADFVYEGTDVSVDFDWAPLRPGPTVTAHFVHDGSPQPVTITQVDVSSLDGGGLRRQPWFARYAHRGALQQVLLWPLQRCDCAIRDGGVRRAGGRLQLDRRRRHRCLRRDRRASVADACACYTNADVCPHAIAGADCRAASGGRRGFGQGWRALGAGCGRCRPGGGRLGRRGGVARAEAQAAIRTKPPGVRAGTRRPGIRATTQGVRPRPGVTG